MAQSPTQAVGARAEQLALDHLIVNGLRCLQRNFRSRFGEIDLIMLDDDCLVFVEVRFRSRNRFSNAAMSVGLSKQRKIILTASYFLRGRKRYANAIMRFDVVAIDSAMDGQYTIQWLKDAFRPAY
jgi:putative endonuclease